MAFESKAATAPIVKDTAFVEVIAPTVAAFKPTAASEGIAASCSGVKAAACVAFIAAA